MEASKIACVYKHRDLGVLGKTYSTNALPLAMETSNLAVSFLVMNDTRDLD
jgi:hypothetical protein